MAGRMMDSLKRFFTLEEDSYNSRQDSEGGELYDCSISAAEHPVPEIRSGRSLAPNGGLPPRRQEIVVLEPVSFADAREIAETLKLNKCILLNMRKTDKELARRIVDFLSGISYAVEGQSQKVADNIYLFTPGHFDIVIHDQFNGKDDGGHGSAEGY